MPKWVFDVLRYAPVLIYILVLFVLFMLGKFDNDWEYGGLTREEKKAILKQNLAFVLVLIYYTMMSFIEFFIYET